MIIMGGRIRYECWARYAWYPWYALCVVCALCVAFVVCALLSLGRLVGGCLTSPLGTLACQDRWVGGRSYSSQIDIPKWSNSASPSATCSLCSIPDQSQAFANPMCWLRVAGGDVFHVLKPFAGWVCLCWLWLAEGHVCDPPIQARSPG